MNIFDWLRGLLSPFYSHKDTDESVERLREVMGEKEHFGGHWPGADRSDIRITFGVTPDLKDLLERFCPPSDIGQQLSEILGRLNIMPTQDDFDAQVAGINAKIDTLTTAVSDEAAQVQAFIAAHPDLDTSALQGVADRLDALSTSVAQIDPQDVPAPVE